MNLRLPPHIAWPAFVVALLLMSFTAVLLTVLAARSDGGAQVIDDYYEKAAAWDETMAEQAASEALGWQADVAIVIAEDGHRAVVVTLHDAHGEPLDRLAGTVRAFRPHLARAVAMHPLTPTDTPGVYRQPFRLDEPGLWDFEVVAVRDGARYQTTIRKEVSQ